MMGGLPAVFLDRDGIINQSVVREGKPYPPASVQEAVIIPTSISAFQKLHDAGFILIGITNQPDVARGTQDREEVLAINDFLLNELPLADIYVCFHDNNDYCDCRKPKPGLILEAAEKFGVYLEQSWMIGDRWKDIAAGKAAGVKTIFVDYNYEEVYKGVESDFTVNDTSEIAEIILKGII